MIQITSIPSDLIDQRSDARPLDSATIDGLIQSIRDVGLINPIRVRRLGDRYEIVSGHHRFGVCAFLEWAEIPCIVAGDDDLHAELAMIDENLMRNELSASDRAIQTARRKAIHEEIFGPAKANSAMAANASMGRGDVNENFAPTFSAATAKATGQSERAVQLHAERGEKVADEALALVRGTKLDSGVYLDKLKRVPKDKQVEKVKVDLAAPKPDRTSSSQGGVAGRYQAGSAAPRPSVTFDDIRAALETLCQLKAEDFQKLCPPNKRPAMHQRMDRLITVFEQVKEAVSG